MGDIVESGVRNSMDLSAVELVPSEPQILNYDGINGRIQNVRILKKMFNSHALHNFIYYLISCLIYDILLFSFIDR